MRLSAELRQAGARVGMTLAQVRAICPQLIHLPYEPAKDLRALEALGRWMMRFSPVVALDPPEGLLLEVGGCERVFGGLDVLLARVDQTLRKLGLP
ncbi:MAG TPA: hypothetical protein VH370_10875, partial [Humisphaera sp.]|nr:hypothetical protein [Humisphaera sp.]